MKNLTTKSILVVGDIILDSYVYGTATRLSAEAPVPIISIKSTEHRLGGAANVASNVASLGDGKQCLLIGPLGHDEEGATVRRLLDTHGITYMLPASGKPTSHKTRIMANNQQIARLDRENPALPAFDKELQCREFIDSCNKCEIAAVIVSDYDKGAVTDKVLNSVGTLARSKNIPIFIDPKTGHHNFYSLNGCEVVLTPNRSEAEFLTGIKIKTVGDVEDACRKLMVTFGCKYVLITRGPDGMSLCTNSQVWGRTPNTVIQHIPTTAKSVFDVSGAGDTVIATLALAYVSGYDIFSSALLANLAAGIVVGKAGTATVSAQELNDAVVAAGLEEILCVSSSVKC